MEVEELVEVEFPVADGHREMSNEGPELVNQVILVT